jgi:hypothetical protein
MSNRLDDQSPRTDWPALSPIGPDELELYLRRGRQLRAKAFAEGLKLTARALARAFGAIAWFIRNLYPEEQPRGEQVSRLETLWKV